MKQYIIMILKLVKVLINEEYPFALIKYSNENFNKDFIFKTKNGSLKFLYLNG